MAANEIKGLGAAIAGAAATTPAAQAAKRAFLPAWEALPWETMFFLSAIAWLCALGGYIAFTPRNRANWWGLLQYVVGGGLVGTLMGVAFLAQEMPLMWAVFFVGVFAAGGKYVLAKIIRDKTGIDPSKGGLSDEISPEK